jgi:hypothetical protein
VLVTELKLEKIIGADQIEDGDTLLIKSKGGSKKLVQVYSAVPSREGNIVVKMDGLMRAISLTEYFAGTSFILTMMKVY